MQPGCLFGYLFPVQTWSLVASEGTEERRPTEAIAIGRHALRCGKTCSDGVGEFVDFDAPSCEEKDKLRAIPPRR